MTDKSRISTNRSPKNRWLGLAIIALFSSAQPALAQNKSKFLPPLVPRTDDSVVAPADPPDSSSQTAAPQKASEGVKADSQERVKDLLRQAIAAYQKHDSSGAEQLFRQALTIDPTNVDANYNLGSICEEKHDLQGALRYLTTAAKSAPQDREIQEALASVRGALQKGRNSNDASAMNQGAQRLVQLGQDAAAAYKAGNFDEAIQDLQTVVKESPKDAGALFGLGQAYHAKGDDSQAVVYLKRAADLQPENQLYLTALRDAKQQLQRAADSREQGLRYTPDRRAVPDDNDWVDDSAGAPPASASRDGVQPFTGQGESGLRKRKSSPYGDYQQAIDDETSYPQSGGSGLGSAFSGSGLLDSPTTYTYQYQSYPAYGAPIYGGYPAYAGVPAYGVPAYRIPHRWNIFGGGNVYGGNPYGGNLYGGGLYGGNVYGGTPYGGNVYGGGVYGGGLYGGGVYGGSPYGGGVYGSPYGGNLYGGNPYGGNLFGGSGFTNGFPGSMGGTQGYSIGGRRH